MKKVLRFTALMLILAGSFISCSEKENEVFPVDISFTEYSLDGTSCKWTNLNYDNKVIVVGSSEDLRNYITGGGGSYPEIDFSKHSLLLVSGKTNNAGVAGIALNGLEQLAANQYELNVELTLYDATVAHRWVAALVTNKVNAQSNIVLNTKTSPGKAIPFTEFSLNGTSCQWKQMIYYTLLFVINSNDELDNYIDCTAGSYPQIDFSTHTLLLAIGTCTSAPIHSIEKQFLKISDNEYSLYVDVKSSVAMAVKTWLIAIKVPKLPQNAVTTLKVTNNGWYSY